MLLLVIAPLLLRIFWLRLWFSNNNETVIFELLDLISSELTYLLIWFWAVVIFCLSLLSSLLVFRFVLLSLTITLSSFSVISSGIAFSSIRSVSVISVIEVSSFSLSLLFNRLLSLYWSSNRFLNNRCCLLFDYHLRYFRCFFSNWLNLLNFYNCNCNFNYNWSLNFLRWNYFSFYLWNLDFDFLYFWCFRNNIIHNLFLVDLNLLNLLISMLLSVVCQSFL